MNLSIMDYGLGVILLVKSFYFSTEAYQILPLFSTMLYYNDSISKL